jgi:phage shock protein A
MFQRIRNLIRGFMSLFISGLERQNPHALLEAEKENLRIQIAKYNQGLASHAGLCERLMSQVKKLEVQERELVARTTVNLKAGNQAAAGQYALRLQTIRQQLGENRIQLEQAEKTYKELLRARDVAIEAATKKIQQLTWALDDLKIKQATAELTEMASGMISEIGSSGDTLNRLEGMVEEERSKAAGRARVAKDSLDLSKVDLQEAEQEALAAQALAEFAASEGIVVDTPAVEVPVAAKTLGPVSEG